MEISPQNIAEIKNRFAKMQNRMEFIELLNFAKPFVYGEKAKPFDYHKLMYFVVQAKKRKVYTEFVIKKKSGANRTINAPVKGLKAIQRTLAFVLQCVFEPHESAFGFAKSRSIVDNAKFHVGKRFVYNIDLKDFFPSIEQARIWKCLQLQPFNLNEQTSVAKEAISIEEFQRDILKSNEPLRAGRFRNGRMAIRFGNDFLYFGKNTDLKKRLFIFSANANSISKEGHSLEGTFWVSNKVPKPGRLDLANIIASLCTAELMVERKNSKGEWVIVKRNVLPQGAPTSPVVTNIVCQKLDYLLTHVARHFGLRYTRYADDITFSSNRDVFQVDSRIKNKQGRTFIQELERIIQEQGFHINAKKTRLQSDMYRQEVTGLLVNDKVNVQQRYIKQLRMWLYYWERYGYERASGFFLQQYIGDKGHVINGKPEMANVISGKLDYLKMVKGADNELYLKLKRRFDAFTVLNKDEVINTPSISMGNILSIGGDFENIYTTKKEAHQKDTNRLRININPIDFAKGQIKLRRKIIIDKGEFLPLEEIFENNEKVEKEIDLSKHKPIDVTRFLLNFRSSEGLKFLTHDYDKPGYVFDYNKIIAISKKEFKELSTQFIVPVNLLSRIFQFAFGDPSNSWWFNRLPYNLNWQSHELLSWMEANPITHPINNEVFEKGFITPFKKSIEIKAPDLEYIFKKKLAENLASKYLSFDIELIDLDKANFYTNVDALQVGISYIFKSINQRFKNSNKIRIEFLRKADDEGRKRIIKIIHLDSKCDKPLDKKDLFQGDLLEAEKAFFGICDWSIISKSPDDSVNKLNLLFDINSNKMPKEKIEESLIEGFTHILTFYA